MKKILLTFSIFCFALSFAQKGQSYLQIGYGSICCGTPSTDPVMNYINQFQKKNKIKSIEVLKQSGMGREGEFNLYICIDNLSKTQQPKFIKGLQTAVLDQNSKRKQNSDGIVNFEEVTMISKADLANSRNLTIYKK
ncbi:hypothetical protein ACM39_06175 [Chryseobacterium sp. FH2]|uniref:hypothetical protein n=1 Tax=Chryseobacterium sp. FH2 TaxID=1674291 RepID=UPI00065ADDFA|nr:hypothetical protein [Chryseobacterium sp. FH2]KMQ68868.1 hypothetical protein ACM39_06175 [Chryseobacterium sp. FH2]